MAYGLLLKNSAGVTVLDTSSMVLNYETVAITGQTINAGSSVNVTIEGGDDVDTIEADVTGTGQRDIDITRSTDTVTFTNNGSSAQTVDFQFFRLK